MKFSTATVLSLSAIAASSSSAFVPHPPTAFTTTRQQKAAAASALYSTTEEQEARSTTKKEDRLKFMKSDQFHRRGFKEVRESVETTIVGQFQSPLVDDLKASNYVIDKDGVKVYLAKVCFYV
jgi:4-hydroxy-3-methylbut-2-enyl diphosphate reductase